MNRLGAIKVANAYLKKENKSLLNNNRDEFTSINKESKKANQKQVPELIKALAQTKENDREATNVYEVDFNIFTFDLRHTIQNGICDVALKVYRYPLNGLS